MFTYDGMKKVDCILESNKVVINGVGFEIICKKETTSEKSKLFVVPAILGFVALILGGEGTREFIGGDRTGSLFLLVPFILLILTTIYLAIFAMIQNRSRSLWRLNFFHTLCVENDDDSTIESVINNLPVPDEATLPKPVNQFFTKNDIAILIVLAIVLVLSFKDVVPIWVALMFPGYAAWLRIRDVIWDFKNLKWQRPTSH